MTLTTATNTTDTTTSINWNSNAWTTVATDAQSIWDVTEEMVNKICSNFSETVKEDTKGTEKKDMNIKNKLRIEDYKIINNTVVIVTFEDRTTEKAVCNKNDVFDFERAIEICVLKKMLGGTKAYNDLIKNAMKDIKYVDDMRKWKAEREELEKRREAKIAKRKAKRKAQRKQQRIDDMSEAFLKAMLDYDDKILEMDAGDTEYTSEDVNMPENVSN